MLYDVHFMAFILLLIAIIGVVVIYYFYTCNLIYKISKIMDKMSNKMDEQTELLRSIESLLRNDKHN